MRHLQKRSHSATLPGTRRSGSRSIPLGNVYSACSSESTSASAEPKVPPLRLIFFLLPPFAARQIAKLLEGNEVTGAGDGNRTEHPLNSQRFQQVTDTL